MKLTKLCCNYIDNAKSKLTKIKNWPTDTNMQKALLSAASADIEAALREFEPQQASAEYRWKQTFATGDTQLSDKTFSTPDGAIQAGFNDLAPKYRESTKVEAVAA